MFYLDQQRCQTTRGLRGQRPYCTWDLGAAGIGSRIGAGTKLQLIILAALMLWQQGKQNRFWRTGRMQWGQTGHL